jgi:hypothetical protein
MFQASLPVLFGPRFAAENPDCEHNFYEMEEEFELATTPIPHFLLKKFCRGKASLLAMFKRLVERTNAGNGEDTMVSALIKVYSKKKHFEKVAKCMFTRLFQWIQHQISW